MAPQKKTIRTTKKRISSKKPSKTEPEYRILDFKKDWSSWISTLKEEVDSCAFEDLFGKSGVPSGMSEEELFEEIEGESYQIMRKLDNKMLIMEEYRMHHLEGSAMQNVWDAAPIEARKIIAEIIILDVLKCKVKGFSEAGRTHIK